MAVAGNGSTASSIWVWVDKSKIPTAGEKLADLKRCVNALSGLGRGHADVDDCYVGTVIFDGPHERWRIVGLCDGFDACLLEEFRDCLADQGCVADQDQAQRHGASIGLNLSAGVLAFSTGTAPFPGRWLLASHTSLG